MIFSFNRVIHYYFRFRSVNFKILWLFMRQYNHWNLHCFHFVFLFVFVGRTCFVLRLFHFDCFSFFLCRYGCSFVVVVFAYLFHSFSINIIITPPQFICCAHWRIRYTYCWSLDWCSQSFSLSLSLALILFSFYLCLSHFIDVLL